MSAGGRRERIAFDQRSVLSDGYGNAVGDFEEQFIRYARIRPRLGGETVIAARLAGHQPLTITVAYDPHTALIDVSWRARNVKTGEPYNIQSIVNPDERKRELDILCESGVVA